ncbi:MAG: helix-turn-helix domain-containing protein, partial [Acidimicrobiia bacterium]
MSASRSATDDHRVPTSAHKSRLATSRAEERPVPAPLLLTVADVARMLAIGKTAVYHLIWSGELTPVRIGRSVRFAVADLETFVTRR